MLTNKNYKNGQKVFDPNNEYLIYYFKDGTVKDEGIFNDNVMEGKWKFYRNSGQLWQIGHFFNNNKHGEWIRFNRDGLVEYSEIFENGKQL